MQFSSSSLVPFSALFSKTQYILFRVAQDQLAPFSNILAFLCYVCHKNREEDFSPNFSLSYDCSECDNDLVMSYNLTANTDAVIKLSVIYIYIYIYIYISYKEHYSMLHVIIHDCKKKEK